jgi:hypothetical protein
VEDGGGWRYQKKQGTIFIKMGIGVPVEANSVII